MATIEAAVGHLRRGGAGEREQRARVRVMRPVPVLVLGLERGADDAGRRVVDERAQRPELADLARDALGGDVAADEHRLGALGAQLLGGFLGRLVVPHVADRDARRAEVGEAERDRLADPPRAARDEDGGALEAHSFRGSGRSAGAALGIVSQPGRVRASRGPSSAFEDAYPRRSRSSACSSA